MKAADIRDRLLSPWRPGDHADLRGIVCEGLLDLSGLDLCGADFSGSSFPDGIQARGARFLGLSWFSGCMFGSGTDFSGAVFCSDARFEDSRFDGSLEFGGVEFRGIGRFDRMQARGTAGFSAIAAYGNFSLAGVRLSAPADFRNSEWLGGLWCDNAHLPERLDLDGAQVHGRLWLRGALTGNRAVPSTAFPLAYGYIYT
ncbi:MAG: pentapeptide repeat-containing protein [Rhizobiaceae bacterium]